MKHNYFLKKLFVLTLGLSSSVLFGQQTYTFTNASATGQNGPTQVQTDAAYAGTSLNGTVTINTQGVQEWTVPFTGAYRIEALGAEGGHSIYGGGLGAEMVGDFNFTAGQVLQIVVGQQGGVESGNSNRSGGGGGGAFVYEGNTLYIAAGGGAGKTGYTSGGYNFPSADAVDGTPANIGSGWSDGSGGAGGINGNGGVGTTYGGAGAGWLTDGGDASSYAGNQQGYSEVNSWVGGTPPTGGGMGGFGGGGAGGVAYGGGGGGGGYSGGGAGTDPGSGGGAGSFNGGTNQVNVAAINTGQGLIIITQLCSDSPSTFSVDVCDVYTVPSGDSTYVVSGVYNDTIPNATGCDSIMTITVNVTSLDLNTATTDFTITADHASGTYQWINCTDNLPIAGETNQMFTATENGDYAVIITDGPCSDTSACSTISGVGINEVNISNVSIYPNPTIGEFYISSIANAVVVTVYSVDGKVIINNLKVNNSNQSINLGNVENGIYFVEITSDSNKEIIRLIVK